MSVGGDSKVWNGGSLSGRGTPHSSLFLMASGSSPDLPFCILGAYHLVGAFIQNVLESYYMLGSMAGKGKDDDNTIGPLLSRHIQAEQEGDQ